jgi:hypothetical protein
MKLLLLLSLFVGVISTSEKFNCKAVTFSNMRRATDKFSNEKQDWCCKNKRIGCVCCQSLISSCEACKQGVSVKEFCQNNVEYTGCPNTGCTQDVKTCEDGTIVVRDDKCVFAACPQKKCPDKCLKWFDGCNTCKCDKNGNKQCNKQFCTQRSDSNCLENIEDKDEEPHNCYTRESWSDDKRKWCCVEKKVGCAPQLNCPRDCSSWYDGCNTCTCNEGYIGACTEKYCFRQGKSQCFDKNPQCIMVDCAPGYALLGSDSRGCGGNCTLKCKPGYNTVDNKCVYDCKSTEEWSFAKREWCCINHKTGCEYNCLSREVWSAEKREWCCVNQRLGCCPKPTCPSIEEGCTRIWPRDINKHGCAVYPCGIEECPIEKYTFKQPLVRFQDTRGVAWKDIEEDDKEVNIEIIDTKSLVKISVDGMSMKTKDDVVRRRNIIRSIVDVMDGASIEIEKAGFSDDYKNYLKERKISHVALKKVKEKTEENLGDCDYADVHLVDETNALAYEIVLDQKDDRSFKCYQNKPFSLLTLVTNSEDGENEYEARCWNNDKWEVKGTFKEGMNYKCEQLPDYRNEIASDSGTLSVTKKIAETKTTLTLLGVIFIILGVIVVCFVQITNKKAGTSEEVEKLIANDLFF